jgi:hypothetical protein
MASKAQITRKIREAYPNLPADNLRIAVDYFLENPRQFNPEDVVLPVSAMTKLEGGVVSGAKAAGALAARGAKATKDIGKTLIPRTASGKVAKGKLAKRATVLGGAGFIVGQMGDDGDVESQELIANQAQQDVMMGLAQMQASGVDVESLVNTPLGQTLLSSSGINPQLLTGANGVIPTMGGVYLGKGGREIITSAPPSFAGGLPTQKVTVKESLSLKEWENEFPIGDPKKLAEWKKTLVEAGVVSATAGFPELQQQWKAWGEYSQQMSRSGNKLSPYDLLEIQRGLWGGGRGEREPSYSTSLIKTENAMTMFKQGIENLTGRVIDDKEAEEFAKLVRKRQLKKPTKTSVQNVDGRKVTVTDPGFGEAEAARLVERRAQKDPLFSEFQTANVFGSALEKALGVRG